MQAKNEGFEVCVYALDTEEWLKCKIIDMNCSELNVEYCVHEDNKSSLYHRIIPLDLIGSILTSQEIANHSRLEAIAQSTESNHEE